MLATPDPGGAARTGRSAARDRDRRARRFAARPRPADRAGAQLLGPVTGRRPRLPAGRRARGPHARARAAAPRAGPGAAAGDRPRLGDRRHAGDRRPGRRRDRDGRVRRRHDRLGLRASVRRRGPALAVPDGGARLRRRRQPARHAGGRDVQARGPDRHDRHRHPGRRQRRRRPPRRRAARLPGPGVRPRPRHPAPARPQRQGRRRARARPADRRLGALGDRARRDRRGDLRHALRLAGPSERRDVPARHGARPREADGVLQHVRRRRREP